MDEVVMDIKDYKFNVGDKVITTKGETGRIVHICTCDNCKSRGFNEVFWVNDYDLYEDDITRYQAENGFKGYYQIGNYYFNDLEKEKVLTSIDKCEDDLRQLRKQLGIIEILEIVEKFCELPTVNPISAEDLKKALERYNYESN